MKQPPDILNSKIKKIRIELPHYTFSHSSSGDSPHDFIGRVRIKERLKKVIEDSPDEPGVYLIAGNRGVGKTSLVSEIIKETSLRTKTGFIENLKYLLLLLIFVVGTQFCFEQEFICPFLKSLIFWCAISFLFFIILCCFNSYRREIPKQNIGLQILDTITSAFKELSCLVNSLNPYGKTQYVLKIILVVCYTQIISKIQFCGFFPFNKSVETSQITPTKVFVFYLFFIFAVKFWQFIRGRLRRYYIRYKKDKPSKNSIYYIENKGWIWVINILFKLSSIILLFLPLGNGIFNCFTLGNFFIMLIPFYIVLILVCFWCCIYLEKDMLFKIKCIVRILFYDSIINPVRNYLKNHSRLYLRINFGHNLKEKDILRLIARTLNTEYNRYRHSFLRMSPWRIIAFFILLLFACLFTPIVEEQEFYKSLIKEKELYKASSQVLLYKIIGKKNNICSVKIGESEYSIKTKYLDSFFLRKDKKRLKRLDDIFSKKNTKIETKVEAKVETNTEYAKEKLSEHTKIETKIDAKVVDKVNTFLLALDQLVYETTKIVKKAPKFFWEGRKDFRGKYFSPINYLRCLLFLTMYLFCVLIFRCNWISPLFVTHRLIMRRLKILNSDITHSTESENSIYVNNRIAQPMIGSKVKKSRNVADAREIEKELQDILSDMQRIPFIMCRPNIVIVFDELDKVEPGESGSNKENQQTKASLFSIHATRERQTEILKILSNMKYFLSSARAKFIFIAGREMFDIHLADVSDRNNYIGSIFNVVILVPSFLTDHHMGKKYIPQESSIASLPEEFVCRKLIPYDYPVESYDLGNYRKYLKNVIYKKEKKTKEEKEEEIQKIIAVLQQFIIYLAHVSKGAPKKMMQLFESFVEIRNYRDDKKNTLLVQRYYGSFHFLSFNYYKQYTIGIVAYLITPIFYRLAESNIKEHSDKLLVSSLRFVDFLFKFHKHSFSWKHLDMSPEMLEVNRAPELKSVAVELLNYLTQVHINKSNFSLSEYKFDGLIANEIFAMAKTDEVFSALFSFSLDEMLPLKKHYQDLLEKKEKEYKKKEKTSEYIDAVSSLQGVLGDLHYYDDELEEAEAYYKSAVQGLSKSGQKKGDKMTLEQLYVYIRNMLRLGIIYEKRKQYDFAYMTYGELCKRIIQDRKIPIDIEFRETTYEGLKMLYLPFIAKIQILEKSHVGGITSKHLKQLDCEFKTLIDYFDCKGIKLLKSEFYSRVADILYYKNSDLKEKNRIEDNDEAECNCENEDTAIDKKEQSKNYSCTACYYYLKGLSALLNKSCKNTVEELLNASVEQLLHNYNVKFCTILARILSDWGNVFFSCDTKDKENRCRCYICDSKKCNTITEKNNNDILLKCIEYLGLEEKKEKPHTLEIKKLETKKDIALAMYSISSVAYHKAGLYKRSSYQIYKILYLFKYYEINNENYITKLSEKAIHYLWHANDDLNIPELNKRKKDLGKKTIKDIISLKNLLVDTEITRIRILVKELGLKQDLTSEKLNEYYKLYITSPYRINYSIVARIYRLRLKSKVNYKAYKKILEKVNVKNDIRKKDFLLEKEDYDNVFNNEECIETVQNIFGIKYDTKEIFENLIADSIYCLTDIAQLLETMEETYLFPHSFLGSIHEHLSFWIRQYEAYEIYKGKNSRIDELLDQYLGEEWREQLSGYRENQRALSHYYKCLEMHSEGRAYQNMLDIMVYIKDDFNDRSDHFNIAEERHLIVNEKIDEKIKNIKDIYKDSELYKVDNYFNEVHP